MKKFVKIFTICLIFVALTGFLSTGLYIGSNLIKYSSLEPDYSSLTASDVKIPILDKNGKEIADKNSFSSNYVRLKEMPPHTYQSFISIEDKSFYAHNGINPKRILGATFQNLKNRSFSQGASTISQQLIKNTHLSSAKTIQRKIKEISLTLKMEKKLSKEEILESYLNVIYFGNNCYGILNASQYYFSKPCKDLTLEESAMLAGIIKSPTKYSPILNKNECLKRRNIVLSEMLKDKKISETEYYQAINKPITLNLKNKGENKLNSYSEAVIDEAKKILHLPAKQVALGGYRIHTYQDPIEQAKLEKVLEETDFLSADYSGMILDVKSHGITAYIGKSTYKILDAKRQPGSTIKPILVYGPALNEDIISPETQILDEKIKINEYCPENVNKKFSGYVSVKDAVSKSINIPAVKVLSYVGLEKAKSYAKSMGIEFDKKDSSYALALGGMTYGVNIKDLCSAYSTFANEGKFAEGRFISFITNSSGKIVYKHLPSEKSVLRKDSSYLMTNMLKSSAKEGTAKKLSNIKTEIASKTGTVGKPHSKQNLDAWNISYTPSTVYGVWAGNLNNEGINISGGNQPTEVVKKLVERAKIEKFAQPNEIVEREIDTLTLEKEHRVTLANNSTPKRFKKTCIFSIFNLPAISENFSSPAEINFKAFSNAKKPYILLSTEKHISYEIYCNSVLIRSITESEGEINIPVDYGEIKVKARYIGQKSQNEKTINISPPPTQIKKKKNWWEE